MPTMSGKNPVVSYQAPFADVGTRRETPSRLVRRLSNRASLFLGNLTEEIYHRLFIQNVTEIIPAIGGKKG